ncbi:hypothetical protein G7085_06235 [Tessaracoccus sp. HDW20]|uniref:hypothetical protein n=1 Tax=Tessaracoccus coleopterorum TaxID=2714950 RepID=UPI0018D375AE|nr:hypothetical protein [Tessaracoccus coleopterorum]NHB84339.1 hypothetical protein [Tessaracoccus coleopterorum]
MKLNRIIPTVAAVAAVAAVTLLGACSPAASTAAVLNGEVITEASIDQAMTGCAEALQVDTSQLVRQGAVQTMALASVFDSVVADFGEFSDDQVDKLGASQGGQSAAMLGNEDCRRLARDSVKVSLLGQLDQQVVTQALQSADIELNPRYGRWDPTDQGLFGSASLSVSSDATLR